MDLPFVIATLAKRGLLNPGSPIRIAAQLNTLRRWGFSLAGELRQAAARNPDRTALVDEEGGDDISYRHLLERSERLARSLRTTLGLQPGDRIGVLCRNHHALVETVVAAPLIGTDAVLVNTGLSGPQLAVVADEQRLRAVIYDAEFTERVADLAPNIERIDESRYEELVADAPADPLPPPTRQGRTIVLTSGTTGAPKGARRPTPASFRPLISILDRIPLRVGERILIAAPIFHTWGYAALQVSFALRATVVLQRRFDPAATLQALADHRCSALFAVPVMLQRMLEVPPPPARPPLRVVAASGSALPGGLATRFMDVYGDVLYNLYGSTEVSWAAIATPAELRQDPTTAGRPPYGTRVAILDTHGNPVPARQVGRIFVGNEMVFDGYTSGTTRESVDGLLSTGDLGHLDDQGLLFVDGREDDMIISGGENIYPSEVEELLAGLQQVREVVVVGVPDEEYGQRLAAYLVLHPGESLDAEAVRDHVRRHRARFSVPRDVLFVPSLPRNATGKVVTRNLPQPRS
ncbi:MAG TPA: AMP-binding protein [Micromonosporaceae bacterium]|nr:AMP-binding protein [Micromonosporaceae bacterium]